jgi:hypothetical protein
LAKQFTKGQVLLMEMVEAPRVVAIGASAGGLSAFQRLIENLPGNTGLAFVLLTHILRGSTSLLPEILGHSTKMQVIQVSDRMKLLANHIYVLPPDKLMEIREGLLHLVSRPLRGQFFDSYHYEFDAGVFNDCDTDACARFGQGWHFQCSIDHGWSRSCDCGNDSHWADGRRKSRRCRHSTKSKIQRRR